MISQLVARDEVMAQHMTRSEYKRWAATRPGRYERIAGEPVAMSPERAAHIRVKARIWAALDREVRHQQLDCEALADGITVEIDDDTDYEPDAVINCGPRIGTDDTAAPNPVVVVEVLSPGTQSIDSGLKLTDYFRLASVQHYLIVSARRREIVHHRRSGSDIVTRIVHIGTITLDPPGIAIDINDIYVETGLS
jgi:Uma2 family endonuclease